MKTHFGFKIITAGISSLIILGFSVFLPADENIMTPEKIVQMKRISDPQLSPDGQRIAYVLRYLDEEKLKYTSDIYMVDIKTGEKIQLTYDPENDNSPRWSPDGTKIAFLSNRSGKSQIRLISLRGGESHALTEVEEGAGNIAWSPDGWKIAFLTRRPLTEEEKKAKEEKRDQVVFEEDLRLSVVAILDLKSKRVKHLTDGSSHVTSVEWAPDGRCLALNIQPSSDVDDHFHSKIHIFDIDQGALRRLTQESSMREMSPVWSPDGKTIAFVGHPGIDFWADPPDIFVIPAGGGSLVNLTSELDRAESILRWTRNSGYLYFSMGTKTYRRIGRIHIATKKIELISPQDKLISSVSLDDDGEYAAFLMTDPENPQDLWFGDLGLKTARLLVQSNPDMEGLSLGKTEVIQWKSFDGMLIEGILVYPVGYQSGQKVPLIVAPHGGPQGYRTISFNPPWQMLAGAGYAVFAPNFRGSGNYGREFVRANIGDWGGGDYKDIMTGVDYLIKKGIADPEKLGVEGWSYGGFMTNWIVTHTGRFKAAVSGAGLSNLVSFFGTTDIQGFMEYYHKGVPWKNWEIYRGSSPLMSEHIASTPTLILHGEEDRRVPISQSEELYYYLKKNKVTVRFVRYPREPHGLGEPNHQIDRYKRMLGWFQQYIHGNQ